MTESESRDSEKNIEMTVAELQIKIPDVEFSIKNIENFLLLLLNSESFLKFPWTEWISKEGLFLSLSGEITMDETEPLSIDNMEYLVKMATIYSDYATNKPE